MAEYEVPVPRDIEADIVASFAEAGIKASTIVPADRKAGTIRVSRTGGTDDEYEGQRDVADLLVEVWADDSVEAYATAQRCYAALMALALRGRTAQGEAIYSVEVAPPRTYDDPLTPDLYRVTLTAQISTTLENISIHLED